MMSRQKYLKYVSCSLHFQCYNLREKSESERTGKGNSGHSCVVEQGGSEMLPPVHPAEY